MYAAWLTDKRADHWEVMTINSELQDFGVSHFKERTVDTVFTRITLRWRNRMLARSALRLPVPNRRRPALGGAEKFLLPPREQDVA
jgi:hypothetical protein